MESSGETVVCRCVDPGSAQTGAARWHASACRWRETVFNQLQLRHQYFGEEGQQILRKILSSPSRDPTEGSAMGVPVHPMWFVEAEEFRERLMWQVQLQMQRLSEGCWLLQLCECCLRLQDLEGQMSIWPLQCGSAVSPAV